MKTVKAMIIGSILYNVCLMIGVIIFSLAYFKFDIENINQIIINIISVFLGSISSVLGINSLYRSIEGAANLLEEKKARNYVVFGAIVRKVTFCLILILLFRFTGFCSGIIYALSVFSIKVGAYLAPIIMKRI